MRLCIERRSAAMRGVSILIVGIVEQAEQLYDLYIGVLHIGQNSAFMKLESDLYYALSKLVFNVLVKVQP